MEGDKCLLKPGQNIKPHVPNEVVHELIHKLYNLEVTSIKELNSYDDKNFHLMVKNHSSLPDPSDACADGYVLKILNSLDSKESSFIDAQNQMMLFLVEKGIPCPRPITNIKGTKMTLENFKKDLSEKWVENNDNLQPPIMDQHVVRLLSFLPGEILYNASYTKDLFYEVGELTAKIDLALLEFKHAGVKGVERIWNLNTVPELINFMYVLQDKNKYTLAIEVINNFQSYVLPNLSGLECGPIHGDLNEQNILVQLNKRNTETFHVSGILDFGDVQFNYYVFELSIVICYMMIECKLMDILDAPGHVLAGYNRLRHIPDAEFDLLKDCISARFCQSLVLGAYSYSQNPDPYLLTTSKRGWECLQLLWDSPKQALYKRWRYIMESYHK